jgi:hypothetical protein
MAVIALAGAPALAQEPREETHRSELVAWPGPWSFLLPHAAIILVSDQELEALSDPDAVLNLTLGREPRMESLRQVCLRAQARGAHTLTLAFDHFFRQYRPGQDAPRRLMPDMDEYIRRVAAIGQFAQRYGLGLELSLLSPLEIGKAYAARTGESGVWMHYREGLRDPVTGAFSVQLWRHKRWANNKGPVDVEDAGVRAFAFRENRIPGTPYRVVDPAAMVEVTADVGVERFGNVEARAGDFRAERIRVYSNGPARQPGLDRVLVIQQYRTPEMDYFSPKALPFLTELIDRYAAAGVPLHALYSDEMHIQQDWAYFSHHDAGQFALRYVSPGLEQEFARRYGAQYRDFARYLIYFTYGQEDFANDLSARQGVMHVFGASPEEIRRTALFRARYYRLLQDGVVDLFVAARRYAERKFGRRLPARAHATWAESPPIDYYEVGRQNRARHQYEYTSNFVWSNTVHQAASACYDYFKWGDFLTGNGNDHTEGGWLDRNYFALALAASTGILNEVPYSYAAHWGMPAEISRRRASLVNASGAGASLPFALVEDMEHRDVEVLMLYPLDLVAVEERFGSWMTQYGYANYVTAAKLLERGAVRGGAIEMAGRRFTTLVALFEPFPPARLLELMSEFVRSGGRLIWSGPPPLLTWEGEPALPVWQSIFGVTFKPDPVDGLIAAGQLVRFEGPLAGVAPQIILTDFLVDRIYPVQLEQAEAAARVKNHVVGSLRRYPGGGLAAFLGYRPRDDQSRSLGYDSRNWFEVLSALGAYPPTGRFAGVNDNTEHLSRTGPYLVCRFPNGAIALAPHLRELEEDWPGGFARDAEADRAIVARLALPSEAIRLREFKVHGHTVSYEGERAVAFRVNAQGRLVAFAGHRTREITVDGRRTVFADQPMELIAWAPVSARRRVPGGAVLQIIVEGEGTVRIPLVGVSTPVELVAEGSTPGSRGAGIPCRVENDRLVFTASKEIQGRSLYVVPAREAK